MASKIRSQMNRLRRAERHLDVAITEATHAVAQLLHVVPADHQALLNAKAARSELVLTRAHVEIVGNALRRAANAPKHGKV